MALIARGHNVKLYDLTPLCHKTHKHFTFKNRRSIDLRVSSNRDRFFEKVRMGISSPSSVTNKDDIWKRFLFMSIYISLVKSTLKKHLVTKHLTTKCLKLRLKAWSDKMPKIKIKSLLQQNAWYYNKKPVATKCLKLRKKACCHKMLKILIKSLLPQNA